MSRRASLGCWLPSSDCQSWWQLPTSASPLPTMSPLSIQDGKSTWWQILTWNDPKTFMFLVFIWVIFHLVVFDEMHDRKIHNNVNYDWCIKSNISNWCHFQRENISNVMSWVMDIVVYLHFINYKLRLIVCPLALGDDDIMLQSGNWKSIYGPKDGVDFKY